jgi:hypothetical protein
MSGGALIQMVATGRPEVERWLSRIHPETELIDFEQSSSLAALAGFPAPLTKPIDDELTLTSARFSADQMDADYFPSVCRDTTING